jgi:transposase
MPVPRALSLEQMHRAAELYRDGKSRREVAAILRVSETPVRTALRDLGVPMRPTLLAAADAVRRRTGWRRKTQWVASVFDLGRG